MKMEDKCYKITKEFNETETELLQDMQILNAVLILLRELNDDKLSVTLQDIVETRIDKIMDKKVK